MKKAIILMGPPGAGKGTQAELISDKFGFIHFDIGRHIENMLRSKKMPLRVRRQFRSGDLVDPSWTLQQSRKGIKQLAGSGLGIVLSGSLRTSFEAFGSQKNEGVLRTLTKAYSKQNIIIFEITIPPRITLQRNSKRKVCSICWKPYLSSFTYKACPFCGGKLIRRAQDHPAIIKNRLLEYRERTKPVIDEIKKAGFKVIKVDGRPNVATVFAKINRYLK